MPSRMPFFHWPWQRPISYLTGDTSREYRDNGKENRNYHTRIGIYWGCITQTVYNTGGILGYVEGIIIGGIGDVLPDIGGRLGYIGCILGSMAVYPLPKAL